MPDRCKICSGRGAISFHHWIYDDIPPNGIYVCEPCHMYLHEYESVGWQRGRAKEDGLDNWRIRAFEQLARLDLVIEHDCTDAEDAFEVLSHEWFSNLQKKYDLTFESDLIDAARRDLSDFFRRRYPEHFQMESQWLLRALRNPDAEGVQKRVAQIGDDEGYQSTFDV